MNLHEQRKDAKSKTRRRRQRHRDNGLCLDCTSKAIFGRRFCSLHLAKARTKAKQEYDWRIANGVCVSCGIPKEEKRTGTKCIACATKAAAKERRRRRTQHICQHVVSTGKRVRLESEAFTNAQGNQHGNGTVAHLGTLHVVEIATSMAHKEQKHWGACQETYPEADPPLPLSA